MNYENQTLIDMLAAEYVLGTLRGPARDRFARLMLTSTRAREATWMWEQHLNNLASSIESIPPDDHVWEKIVSRVDPDVIPIHSKAKKSNSSILQAWSLIATAACIVLALIIWQPHESAKSQAQQIALFKNQEQTPLWFIDVQQNNLSVKASAALIPRTDKDYELWMIIKGQEAPISLGLLPKSGRLELPKDARFNADDISLLAVSLEPLGGSPNGSPTEVLYTTELVVL
ncbi:anti-sigma factor (plasmid) [Pseudoalteromonas sp. CF6-2]|uniref:anti-sigma factor n=1 Tax=Pseudoalteromonas TaxID=53246 RepID=UPI000786146C|nr:anti-sigma factor [Pseudoalteromonas arabiensis]UJX27759.1 anti-sigma factor [Pseudoalteromonas sp. CF6-2]|tara:strand:+ start:7920 stop:8609 length:690 start_codon:yes stop_codon:yes gene_type:complete